MKSVRNERARKDKIRPQADDKTGNTNEKHIVTIELAREMRERKHRGESCRHIADSLGFSKSTVSIYTRDKSVPIRRREPIARPILPWRHGVRYEVLIERVYRQPKLKIRAALDHRPVYSDMMRLCRAHGLPAVDFADDPGTHPNDREYHGRVFVAKTRMQPLAHFTVRRLRGDVRLEDFFR